MLSFITRKFRPMFAFAAIVALAAGLFTPAAIRAQAKSPAPAAAPAPSGQTEAPRVNPQEEADYAAFFKAEGAEKKFPLGRDFLEKYPDSRYTEPVYNQLVNAYYSERDWNDFYAVADKALAKDSNDVDVLVLVGWVIPHFYQPGARDAAQKLEQAQNYEKRAITLLLALDKPAWLTDSEFASAKAEKLSRAHSGLGLAEYWSKDYADSVKELQQAQAIQGAPAPDQTDFYIFGMGLEKLKRYPEAADAYQKCGQIPGALANSCKQGADRAKGEAAQSK